MSEDENSYNEIEDKLRQNSRKRKLNDKVLSRSRTDIEGVFSGLNDWIHDDIINLGEQLETLVDICVDDISRVLLD
ncbi:MAG: hypothetical protein QXJ74_05445, partial [Nitrososphaera sp.]